MTIHSYRMPTDIKFGAGALSELPVILLENDLKRPLIVTDKVVAGLDFLAKAVEQLKSKGLEVSVYSDPQGNPIEEHVTKGVKAYKAHNADAVVLIGGGCALDVGKAIALMIHHPGHLFDYEDEKPGALPVDKKIPYMVAVPTTAGTGSEVGASSVISENDSHAKKIIFSKRLTPNMVLADPEVTLGLPASVTAATGIDALTHNIEAFLAKNYHPMCDGIALEGIRLVFENLKKAVNNPSDADARAGMLLASLMGAVAFQKGLGVTHSCAHSLSTCFDLHHGLANGLMLIPCLKFNNEVVADRMVRMGETIGFKENAGEKFIAWVDELLGDIGLKQTFKSLDWQITDRLVNVAMEDVCHSNNPRPCTKEDFKKLYAQAKEGS